MTLPSSTLPFPSEAPLPLSSGSSWKGGSVTAGGVCGTPGSVVSGSSFAQILNDAQAHGGDAKDDSNVSKAGIVSLPPAAVQTVQVDASAIALAPFSQFNSQLMGPAGVAERVDSNRASISTLGDQDKSVKRSSGAWNRQAASSASAVRASTALNWDALPFNSTGATATLSHPQLQGLRAKLSKQVQVSLAATNGSVTTALQQTAATRSFVSAKVPEQLAETATNIQMGAAPVSFDQLNVKADLAAPLSDVVSTSQTPPQVAIEDRIEAGMVVPAMQFSSPVGTLAFALRLKPDNKETPFEAARKSLSVGDVDSQIASGTLSGRGVRSLDTIVAGLKNVPNDLPRDTSNDITSNRPPQGSSFAAQLKNLTRSLSTQGPPALASDTDALSNTDAGRSDSGDRESAPLSIPVVGQPQILIGNSASVVKSQGDDPVRADAAATSHEFVGGTIQTGSGAPPPSGSAGTAAVSAAASLPEKENPTGDQPVRNVRLQLPGDGSQHVDLRLVERGGTLSVSVRSTDETLTRSLQENLPELNARLGAQHFQTEAWTPAVGVSRDHEALGGNSSSDSGASSNGGSKQGGSSADQRSSSQDHSGQPQEGRDGRPTWVRQLAALDEIAPLKPGGAP